MYASPRRATTCTSLHGDVQTRTAARGASKTLGEPCVLCFLVRRPSCPVSAAGVSARTFGNLVALAQVYAEPRADAAVSSEASQSSAAVDFHRGAESDDEDGATPLPSARLHALERKQARPALCRGIRHSRSRLHRQLRAHGRAGFQQRVDAALPAREGAGAARPPASGRQPSSQTPIGTCPPLNPRAPQVQSQVARQARELEGLQAENRCSDEVPRPHRNAHIQMPTDAAARYASTRLVSP